AELSELGAAPEEAVPAEEPKKNRFFFVFAVFVIIMAIVGCVSTVRFVADRTAKLFDNTSLKNEFSQFIFPVVVNDIAPFESASEIPDSAKITCAIWNILINKETSQYESPNVMGLSIPEYDVAASCKELFGSSASVEHQSVGSAEVRFTYDEMSHTYSASKNIRYLTYAPSIVSMSESNGIYTLVVGYIPPTLASVAGISGMEASPEKYMEYTIERWDGKNTLLSVRFTDYAEIVPAM
ncbi:MAG: hypothetical protein ACI4Q4_06455, partial [Oscillospiraceae bacterium]